MSDSNAKEREVDESGKGGMESLFAYADACGGWVLCSLMLKRVADGSLFAYADAMWWMGSLFAYADACGGWSLCSLMLMRVVDGVSVRLC
ncbi:uncharacterized protein BJ171DRAFT_76029 [Polychytrium aggregatum]|uniref:uncharacterized protein n=1 Tax=Polychytrium aggregatum TaxID=110093 RepID=UPI0022FE3513|nr:uncharacterized protein BJ171DRAFT_76029 [Polychytrium aggregatum]KAI9190650.1 hypothetical protein BJ171DRAFT_76029 [Polychytrium aggregatum]